MSERILQELVDKWRSLRTEARKLGLIHTAKAYESFALELEEALNLMEQAASGRESSIPFMLFSLTQSRDP